MASLSLSRVAVTTNEAKRTTIAISQRTKDALDSIKHPGQSYEGVLQELVKFWRENAYWTRRKEQKTRVPVG